MRWRRLILALLLAATAVKLVTITATRDGLGVFEYLTMALLVALLLQNSYRLLRRPLPH